MNMILEQINSAGYRFVDFALPMLVQSAVLIVVLLLADLLLRKKVRAVVRYWLWMLVLLKLVLPTTLSSPISLGFWFGDELAIVKFSESAPAESVNLSQVIDTGTVAVTGTPQADVRPTVTRSSVAASLSVSPVPLTWQGIVFLVWAAVVIAMGLLLLQRAIFVAGLVAKAKNPTQLMNDTFRFCCGQMGVKGRVGLKVSADTASPAVCGLFRPVILMPRNLAPTLGSSRLRQVLLHELAHIKRGDLWINLAQAILQIIYFYNPLLWLANSIIRRIREQAVDEAVQVAMGANAHQYPQTLLDVAKIAFNRPVLSLRLIGVVESKNALKGRIKRMLDRPIPKNTKLGTLGLVTLIIVGSMLLPMAKAAKMEKVNQNPIGKWLSVDFVQKIGDFTPGEKSWPGELYLKGLEFMKGGRTSGPWTWKKGSLWHPGDRTKARYVIKGAAGSRYLFMEWISGDVTIRRQKPRYYVMKEVQGNKKNESEFIADLEKGITVQEGAGFDDIIVGDPNCTGEFIKSKLGEPDEETKSKKKGWWLNYHEKYGLDFWLNLQENTLHEIRLNKGFKGKLNSGISMSSTKQSVFDAYGQPIREEVAEDFDKRFDNQVLLFREPSWLRKPHIAKIYYNEKGLLFWFDGDILNQIVVSRPSSNNKCGAIDVAVEGFKISPYPAGGLYTVTVAIRNKGSLEAPSFRLNFYQGNPANNLNLHGKPQTSSNRAGPITPGDIWNESSSPFALKEGLNEITVVLDTDQSIAESDETNNRTLMKLVVKDGQLIEKSAFYSPLQKAESPGPKTDVQVVKEQVVHDSVPSVVSTTPAVFDDAVSPETDKITVTFDQLMMDGSWSFVQWDAPFPETAGSPSYDNEKRTCTLPVKLEPAKAYLVAFNLEPYTAFRNITGESAKSYVLVFATKSEDGKPTPIPEELITKAKIVNERAEKPYTQIAYEDIQPDGTILFRNTVMRINRSGEKITTEEFITSDFVHVTDMSDARGPIKFISTHEKDIYRYEATFNEPVPNHDEIEYTIKGTIEGLIKPVPDSNNTFQYSMRHWPAVDQPTLRMETYLLPEGAELISTTPEDMQRQTKDGRIELHTAKIIPPGGSIATTFQYRLTNIKGTGGKKTEKIVE